MIESKLDTTASVLYLYPQPSISKEDFINLAEEIDPYIDENGLHGILVEAEKFPGWDSFGAFTEHMRFVKDHQNRVERIALVTDSSIGKIAAYMAKHFVSAEFKHFPFNEKAKAREWIMSVI